MMINYMAFPAIDRPTPTIEENTEQEVQEEIKITDPFQAIEIALITSYNLYMEDVCIRSRRRDVKQFRQAIQEVMRRHSNLALYVIGNKTGGFDHATVLNSRRKVEECEFIFNRTGVIYPLLEIFKELETRFLLLWQPERKKPRLHVIHP